MVLSEEDSLNLDGVQQLMIDSTIVKDILPRLADVLTKLDFERTENKIRSEDSNFGLIELIQRYKQSANDLNPFIHALINIKRQDIAVKLGWKEALPPQPEHESCNDTRSTIGQAVPFPTASRVAPKPCSSLKLKEEAASIFDDRQISSQMVWSLDPGSIVPFLHGWCLKDDTCREICDTAKTNRAQAVMQLKSGIKLYLRDRDETQTDLLDELKQIIDAFEGARAGEAVINMLKTKLYSLAAD